MRDEYLTLLARLGESMGLPGLSPDEAGVTDLVFDQSLAVRLAFDDTSGQIMAFAEVGEAPPAVPADRLEALLGANLFWSGTDGATLALNGERVVLARAWPLRGLDLPHWEEDLARFVDTATAWANRLAQPAAAAGSSADVPAGMAGIRV